MIIDSHLHFGKFGPFNLSMSVLGEEMDKYHIGQGLISTIECAEYRADVDELMPEQNLQIEANAKLLDHVIRADGRLYISFWCKPLVESNIAEVFDYISANSKWIKGLKFHPFYSRLALEDKRYEAYMDLAGQLDIPVSIHSANDQLSNPMQVLDLASRFPKTKIIMVHMGLLTDNKLGIECISKADNLYGDTSWVPIENVEKAIRSCGSHKILFGSDAPIDGQKSYTFYEDMFEAYKKSPGENWDQVFSKNAQHLFKI
ncbi:MAG TPA: amidohydrolase family protein [Bacillota bacterium]|nr:amidohydrolase family protein [Bacillota bacterium]